MYSGLLSRDHSTGERSGAKICRHSCITLASHAESYQFLPGDGGNTTPEKLLRGMLALPIIHLAHPRIVFYFSWVDCNTQENLETIVIQNWEGRGGEGRQSVLWAVRKWQILRISFAVVI